RQPAAQAIGLAAQLVLAVIDPEIPGCLGPEAVAESRDKIPALRRGHLRSAPRRRVVEGAREEIEVAVQRPEVAKCQVQGRLIHDVLTIPTEVPLASREQAGRVILEFAARP